MDHSSTYIASLPQAEYTEIDNGLSDDNSLFAAITNLVDYLAPGRRGRSITLALNAAGLSTDPAGLQRHYDLNKGVIDEYFSLLDMHKLSEMIGSEVDESIYFWMKTRIPAALVGITIGASGFAMYAYLNKRKKNGFDQR